MLGSKLSLPVLLFSCLVFSVFLYSKTFQNKNFDSEPTPEKISNPAKPEINARLSDSYGKLPIRFEANVGQTDERVKFLARDKGYSLFLTPQSAVMALPIGPAKAATDSVKKVSLENSETRRAVVSMSLLNANPSPKMLGEDELITKSNYFIGSDPEKWLTEITNYGRVRYEEAYPGIDLIYYGNPRRLEYDFVVSPGADPDIIKIKFEGQDAVEIDESGNLILKVESGRVVQNAPVIYQLVGEKRIPVQGRYVLLGEDLVGFRIGEYDQGKSLVIDPSVSFSTYLGGSAFDHGYGIAVDSSENVYVTGQTLSSDFPFVGGSIDSTRGGTRDAFVFKLNAAGSALTYSTYLGGVSFELASEIAVDSSGNAYVTGQTTSSDFPTTGGALDTTQNSTDAFVSKLNAAGSALTYSTYLGGTAVERGEGITVDTSGNAYVTGHTTSSDFPTVSAIDSTLGGAQDGFVSKLNAAGSALTYSTYLGGAGSSDIVWGIVVDSSGNAYVTGQTDSSDFPFVGGVDSSQDGTDAFVSKLNAAGSALTYSTYLGGTVSDIGKDIAVDSSGNAYVTGFTGSSDFPTVSAIDSTLGGTQDGFVSKLNAVGSALVYSTYLGGASDETSFGGGIAVDSSGNAYVTGSTTSTDFPFVGGSIDSTLGGTQDGYVSILNATGSTLTLSTYLGGATVEDGMGIAVDSSGNAYVVGGTSSTDFPTVSPIDSTLGGSFDSFVIKYLIPQPSAPSAFLPPFDVVSPYWQSEAGIYTFISVGHASLSGMNSTVGVVMTALNTDGSLQGSLEFTVMSGNVQRAFITTTNFFFGPVSNPGDRFLIIDSSGMGTGNLGFSSKATNPLVKLGGASISGSGFGDIRALTFWGAIVISSSATGFAMEFIGDMQDSRAFSSANFSGLN